MTLPSIDQLAERAQAALGNAVTRCRVDLGEVALTVAAGGLLDAARVLRDEPGLKFEQLTDLFGVDFRDFGEAAWEGPRFQVHYQLLSYALNQRVRVQVACVDDDFPVLDSVVGVWPGANWYEREAFDLYGIVFKGHPDLRRLLTDYGFVGHPFRKDFPLSGHVEMRFDPAQKRVVYQPVTIEPRNNVPRIVREQDYGGMR